MRSLSAALEAAQKKDILEPTYKVVFSGPASGTFEEDQIISLDHTEEAWHQEFTIVLNNFDDSITTEFEGAKAVITYGLKPPYSSNTSAAAPLYVKDQIWHPSTKSVTIIARGLMDELAEDHASGSHVQKTADLKTVKDLVSEVVKGTIDTRLNDAAYSLDDLVIPITPNGYVFKCTTAGTAGASPPTWDIDIGDTTTDNTIVWTNVGKELTVFSHCKKWTVDFDSEDDLLDSFNPADLFVVSLNDTRLDALRQIMQFTKCVIRVEADGDFHVLVPRVDGPTWAVGTAYAVNDYVRPSSTNTDFAFQCTTAGTSHASTEPTWPTTADGTVNDNGVIWTARAHHYTYKWDALGEHDIFQNARRRRLVQPNFVVVQSPSASDDSYTGNASDASANKTDQEHRIFFNMRLASNAQGTSVATAILQGYQLDAQAGAFSAPLNLGQELFDYVRLKDPRQSPSGTDDVWVWNVGGIQRLAAPGRWEMAVALGDPAQGGFIGLDSPVPEVEEPPTSAAPFQRLRTPEQINELLDELEVKVPAQGASIQKAAARQGELINRNNRVSHAIGANIRRDVNALKLLVQAYQIDTTELNHVTVSANYTAKDKDGIIGVDTDVGAIQITIPTAAATTEGRIITVHDEGSNAAANNITIVTEGSELINENANYLINVDDAGVSLYSDGTDLYGRADMATNPAKVTIITATEANPTVGTAVT